MIKKSDIQIGNYINYEQTTHVVSEIHSDKIIHHWQKDYNFTDPYLTDYSSVSPIEISESVLIRLGFEHFKKNVSLNVGGELFDYWEKTYGEIRESGYRSAFILWTDRKTSYFSLKGILKSTDKRYTYVHELQQLYKLQTDLELKYEKK